MSDSKVPWRSDRPLDIETVGQLIRSQFPPVAAKRVEPIGWGWDFDTYEVDSRWVFRFPRRREYDGKLVAELALLKEVANKLPLPVPDYEFRGRPCEAFPYHFGGYPKLSGVTATDLRLSDVMARTVAEQLGEFLDCLHRCDSERIRGLDLYGLEDEATPEEDRRASLEYLTELSDVLGPSLLRRCRALLEVEMPVPAPYGGPVRLTHSDLLSQHLLLEPDKARITGVLDWSDAARSDPMGDFVGLWMWLGGDSVQAALRRYRLATDEHFVRRIRHRSVCVAIGELYYARSGGCAAYAKFCHNCLKREAANR